MKRILVTGGFGFIGTHLVEELLLNPINHVTVVDDLSTSPVDPDAFITGIGWTHSEYLSRLDAVITTVKKYFRQYTLPHFDEIYHLASVVGPVMLIERGGKILKNMVGDTYDILEYCLQHGTRLLDFSTGEVYGGLNSNGMCVEEGSMIVPPKASARLEYAVGKLACEIALKNTCNLTDLHATIVRPFNATGPRQQPGGGFVLPRFLNQAIAGEPLTVYWEGKGVRTFTHVKDIASGVVLMMERGHRGYAYNIGNPCNKCTVLELAHKVLEISGSKSEIIFVDPRTLWGPLFEECADKYPDVDRAIVDLNWHPYRTLDTIIADGLAYVQARRKD